MAVVLTKRQWMLGAAAAGAGAVVGLTTFPSSIKDIPLPKIGESSEDWISFPQLQKIVTERGEKAFDDFTRAARVVTSTSKHFGQLAGAGTLPNDRPTVLMATEGEFAGKLFVVYGARNRTNPETGAAAVAAGPQYRSPGMALSRSDADKHLFRLRELKAEGKGF